jgi:large subunit ribosomal protein L10
VQGTFDAYAKFIKENKDKEESHKYRFGAMEGKLLDQAGLEVVSKLPSKDELYSTLVYMLKQPSTKLAQTLNEAPSKLGRAIKLSFEKEAESA